MTAQVSTGDKHGRSTHEGTLESEYGARSCATDDHSYCNLGATNDADYARQETTAPHGRRGLARQEPALRAVGPRFVVMSRPYDVEPTRGQGVLVVDLTTPWRPTGTLRGCTPTAHGGYPATALSSVLRDRPSPPIQHGDVTVDCCATGTTPDSEKYLRCRAGDCDISVATLRNLDASC